MDFHKDLFLTFSLQNQGTLWSDMLSPPASRIRALCWICGFMLLFCQLQALFWAVSSSGVCSQVLLPYLQCPDSAGFAALVCTELTAGFFGGRWWLLFYFFKPKSGTSFLPASSSLFRSWMQYVLQITFLWPQEQAWKNRDSFLAFKGHDLYHHCCYWVVIA